MVQLFKKSSNYIRLNFLTHLERRLSGCRVCGLDKITDSLHILTKTVPYLHYV